MFLNILDEPRIILLKKILAATPIPSAYLAGGTALALVLGHRQSIDFGWFTPELFDPESLANQLAEIGTLHTSESKKGYRKNFPKPT